MIFLVSKGHCSRLKSLHDNKIVETSYVTHEEIIYIQLSFRYNLNNKLHYFYLSQAIKISVMYGTFCILQAQYKF